jgi:hypothetical protein
MGLGPAAPAPSRAARHRQRLPGITSVGGRLTAVLLIAIGTCGRTSAHGMNAPTGHNDRELVVPANEAHDVAVRPFSMVAVVQLARPAPMAHTALLCGRRRRPWGHGRCA